MIEIGEFDCSKGVILELNNITRYRTYFSDNWRGKQDWLEEHHKKTIFVNCMHIFLSKCIILIPTYINLTLRNQHILLFSFIGPYLYSLSYTHPTITHRSLFSLFVPSSQRYIPWFSSTYENFLCLSNNQSSTSSTPFHWLLVFHRSENPAIIPHSDDKKTEIIAIFKNKRKMNLLFSLLHSKWTSVPEL